MDDRRSGFSIIELVVVLIMGSILSGIALVSFDGVSGRYAALGAQRTFVSLHARARAQAVEYGETVQFKVNPYADKVWLSRAGSVLESLEFDDEFGVDIRTSTGVNLTV